METLLVAIVTAAAAAMVGRPFTHYQCWFSWSGLNGVAGVMFYLLVGGGGGGVLGWLAALLAHAQPTGNHLADGFLFGAGGALAVRADVGSPDRSWRRSPTDADRTKQAASILGLVLHWTTEMLDELTRRRVEAWLSTLEAPGELNRAARQVALRLAETSLPAATKRASGENLATAMSDLNSTDAALREDARDRIEYFCANFMIQNHLPKPPLPRTPL